MSDEREFWWIFSHHDEPWAGLRIAVFTPVRGSPEPCFIITSEADPRRVGLRHWPEVSEREGWVKVKRIDVPCHCDVKAAMEAKQS